MLFNKLYLPLFFSFSFFISCKNDKDAEPVVIDSISPLAGPHSTVVTIVGSGFNTNATSNLVKFNGKEAAVQSATATQLVVVVPKGAGTGPVSVQGVSGPEFKFEFTTVVSTLAGSGNAGLIDGKGSAASFRWPCGVTVDSIGNIFVADTYNHSIRKITSAGVVTTIAGNGDIGYINGIGGESRFYTPHGITYARDGNLYITDTRNHTIRKLTPSGQVTTLAGSEYPGLSNGNVKNSRFALPMGIVLETNGNLYVVDKGNDCVRKITPSGNVSTYAGGNGYGYLDGAGATAQFNNPNGITFDSWGNLIVTDEYNNCIRKIDRDGFVSKLAGSLNYGFVEGESQSAQFKSPNGVVVDKSHSVFVADTENNAIRKISASGIVSTLAGSTENGYIDGTGQSARFNKPQGIAIDKNGVMYVADSYNNRIRKIVQE